MPSPLFPEAPPKVEPTSTKEIDKALNRLQHGKQSWPSVPPAKRAVLLRECLTDLLVLSDEWIDKCCQAKGIRRGDPSEGEEWAGGFLPLVRYIRMLIDSLNAEGQPKIPRLHQNEQGQWIATVFPADLKEKLMMAGVKAEIWIEPGKEPTQGTIYRQKSEGKISVVLGAGNSGSIPTMDTLYKLFVENEVVILKMNPVNEYLGPYIVRAFRALIEGNFVSVVYGGVETGKYLCSHEAIDTIHVTGSATTHDAIVWGTENQVERKRSNDPVNPRHITSELGCVTPILVVPGPWSDSDVDFQARQIVSMVTQNASFNCNAGDVILLSGKWDQSATLQERIAHHLRSRPGRKAYYPGALDRYQQYKQAYPNAIVCGEEKEGVVPWTIFPDVNPVPGEFAFTEEPFCGIVSITNLDTDSPVDYLQQATAFCNDHIWGSLSINLLIHDKTQKQHQSAFQRAIQQLRYGTIAVNCWDGLNYGLVSPSWGAFPGHTLEDVVSGIGTVHNPFLIDHPEKSVVYAPFRINPTPAWFFDNKNSIALGKALVEYESKPSWLGLLKLLPKALNG